MTPVIPYSISNVSLAPGSSFTRRTTSSSTRFSLSKKISVLNTPCSQNFLLPRSASFRLLPNYQRILSVSATGTDVAVEEPDTPVSTAEESSEPKSEPAQAPAQSKRSRPAKKSEFPPLTNEELVVGATFTGKVVSIQPFGAFVDFGAFTDGLVHVSQLSDDFVKEVGNVVTVGQEVKVRLIEANAETRRISLSMRSGEDSGGRDQQRKESSGGGESGGGGPGRKSGGSKPGQRKGDPRKVSKFVKGQDLEGTVKNMNRGGAYVSLPEGEEGFLPISEEIDDGFGTMMGETTLEVGQEVKVRVLRIVRGQVTLTMKKEEDILKEDVQVGHGVEHSASNPFFLAFRKNKDIAAFLDERKKVEEKEKEPEKEVVSETLPDAPEIQDQPVNEKVETEEAPLESSGVEIEASTVEEASKDVPEISAAEESDTTIPSTTAEETEAVSEVLNTEESVAVVQDSVAEEASSVDDVAVIEEKSVSDSPAEPSDQVVASTESSTTNEVYEQQLEEVTVEDKLPVETEDPSSATTESESAPDSDANESAATSSVDLLSEAPKDVNESAATSSVDPPSEAPKDVNESAATSSIDPPSEAPKDVNESAATSSVGPPSEAAKATISPALVKQLREETGAGMMDCKNALSETGGDIEKAQEYLRKKGLASAEKKASRATAEGRIGSYIHDSRIGVLVEVNCETDFVSRGDIFKELVDDVAMQVAACPQVQYLSSEDVPEEIVAKERAIEIQKEDLMSKPEQIREKIVDGRIKKRLDELALLEQPYIKNDKVLIKDHLKQTIATIGENMKVRRFVRFNLGEGLEKKSQDFAAEVAAQTAAKPVTKSVEEKPKETVETAAPTVAVSAALVKQLREETGAGMMDCKKALSETGGDLEKAQEYLRKKGLASADKKSSRIAAEGRIGSYIHDSRIGVLIEVNCETDFVGRSENFKELVDDLAMQVAACPLVRFVSVDDVAPEVVAKERELEMQREDLQSKPENIREKIVDGRVNKRLAELALLEQPFIKDDGVLIKDLVRQTVAALGENIKVRRFVRFTLGEKLEGEDS